MLYNLQFSQVLFLDIETVSAHPKYDDLSDRMKKLWEKKSQKIRKAETETAEELYPRAAIYAEFGK